jgi:hypothetical protein
LKIEKRFRRYWFEHIFVANFVLSDLTLSETAFSQIYPACPMLCYHSSVFVHSYVLQLQILMFCSQILMCFKQASSYSQSVESSKFATQAQNTFAEDVRQVIKVASSLLSGATERTVPFERIILLEQFVSEAADVWSVPNSRLFALPYSLSRTCRLCLSVSSILFFYLLFVVF